MKSSLEVSVSLIIIIIVSTIISGTWPTAAHNMQQSKEDAIQAETDAK